MRLQSSAAHAAELEQELRAREDHSGTIAELQQLLVSADAEVSAQVKARLETEAQLRVQTEEARAALRSLGAVKRQVELVNEERERYAAESASLAQRLKALRARNEQLEKQAAQTQALLQQREQREQQQPHSSSAAAIGSRTHSAASSPNGVGAPTTHTTELRLAVLEQQRQQQQYRETLTLFRSQVEKLRGMLQQAQAAIQQQSAQESRMQLEIKQLEEEARSHKRESKRLSDVLSTERSAHEAQLLLVAEEVGRLAEQQRAVEATLKTLDAENRTLKAQLGLVAEVYGSEQQHHVAVQYQQMQQQRVAQMQALPLPLPLPLPVQQQQPQQELTAVSRIAPEPEALLITPSFSSSFVGGRNSLAVLASNGGTSSLLRSPREQEPAEAPAAVTAAAVTAAEASTSVHQRTPMRASTTSSQHTTPRRRTYDGAVSAFHNSLSSSLAGTGAGGTGEAGGSGSGRSSSSVVDTVVAAYSARLHDLSARLGLSSPNRSFAE